MPSVKLAPSPLRDAIRSENVKGIVHDGRKGASIEEVGGKAKGLLGLKAVENKLTSYKLDVSVPAFFVVAPEVSLAENFKALRRIVESMGVRSFAVRSSYVLEDVGEHTFDGIFDTKLNVPKDQVIRAIKEVRQSTITARSLQYSSERGITLENRMSVIIQPMVLDPDYTGVVYSKFPSPYDVAKIIKRSREGEEAIDVYRRRQAEDHVWLGDPLITSYKKPTSAFGREGPRILKDQTEGITKVVVQAEGLFGYPIISEFAYTLPESRSFSIPYGDPRAHGHLSLLQARRLANFEEAERFQIPELLNEGLLGQTRSVSGVGDVTAPAVVIYRAPKRENRDFVEYTRSQIARIRKFDREHPDGYILVCPYVQFYFDHQLDSATRNKKGAVAYSDMGRDHDFDLARNKGFLYLGFGNEDAFSGTDIDRKNSGAKKQIIVTGDQIRIVSDGVQGFVYNLSRSRK